MSKTSKPSSSAQSRNGNEIDTFDASEYEFNISASLMSKILEDSIQDTVTKHCDTCICMKSQSKPFCYNESYYSVATQTFLSGDMKNSLCLNCNAEIKSVHSNLSMRSASPHISKNIKIVNEKSACLGITAPYILPQPAGEPLKVVPVNDNMVNTNYTLPENLKVEEKLQLLSNDDKVSSNIDVAEFKQLRKNNTMNMEPSVHHKLCDRTRTSISSKKSSIHSVGNEELLIKELSNVKDVNIKPINENQSLENFNLRKNSLGSMGAVSRTSSVAKSTVSTHKSNTQVGPGPRFCHLRMQAGSKNILLDNAQPDVPPVLYRRQSKCNENSIFKDLNDGMENFMDAQRNLDDKDDIKNDNVVVESTLIDVHVDNNIKESSASVKSPSINPVLLNVSSSPLQPLKTHNFSNSSENNNNKAQSVESQHNVSENENILNEFNADMKNMQNNNVDGNDNDNKLDNPTQIDNHDVKIFNFDRYEQSKLSNLHTRPLRKIDLSQLHSIESTRISKDLPPLDNHQHQVLKHDKKLEHITPKSVLPAVVNVYPNLTQTHLKVNETTKVFTNEQSTSSLSSDDSAALLQKQQLLRVAEWVEKNLEQQNNLNDPLEDDVAYNNSVMRRDSKLNRLSETLNELALNMPHPVSKYSKAFARDGLNNWVRNSVGTHNANTEKQLRHTLSNPKISNNIGKETLFPVESGDATVTEINKDVAKSHGRRNVSEYDVGKELRNALKSSADTEITAEELARMEYNVKKFLLSGPHWSTPETTSRSRRTSSKTETDV